MTEQPYVTVGTSGGNSSGSGGGGGFLAGGGGGGGNGGTGDNAKGGDGSSGGCFSGECTVELADGNKIQMKDLDLGQSIMTLDSKGSPATTVFLGWTERDADKLTSFLEIKTKDGSNIILTATHLIMVNSVMMFAGEVKKGDFLHSSKGTLTKVTSVDMVTSTGFYCPLTMKSTIMAGGLLASCFASTEYYTSAPHKAGTFHQMAHLLFMPIRFCPWILEDNASINKEGLRGFPNFLKTAAGFLDKPQKSNASVLSVL